MYGGSGGEKRLCNSVITEHPFKWEHSVNARNPGQYVLQNWKKISRLEYDLYCGGKGI